jgi:hypothetical protein
VLIQNSIRISMSAQTDWIEKYLIDADGWVVVVDRRDANAITQVATSTGPEKQTVILGFTLNPSNWFSK